MLWFKLTHVNTRGPRSYISFAQPIDMQLIGNNSNGAAREGHVTQSQNKIQYIFYQGT